MRCGREGELTADITFAADFLPPIRLGSHRRQNVRAPFARERFQRLAAQALFKFGIHDYLTAKFV